MGQLDRLEALAQRLVEGTFNRVFQPQADVPPTDTKELSSLATANQQARYWSVYLDDRRLPLGEPVLNLGRALDNDIILSDPTVSRYHAQLRWRGGRYCLYPPDPTLKNVTQHETSRSRHVPHTMVNDQVARELPQSLMHGDVIKLGQTPLKIVVSAEV